MRIKGDTACGVSVVLAQGRAQRMCTGAARLGGGRDPYTSTPAAAFTSSGPLEEFSHFLAKGI